MTQLKTLATALAIAVTPAVFAAGPMESMDRKAPATSQAAGRPVPAEIKKIDAQAGKVTLKHGPIEHLAMPAMTMAFPVKDRASLSNFKEGDLVSVMFDKVGGQPTVVEMRRH
jgi:Cu/Ag efflux protein CusF